MMAFSLTEDVTLGEYAIPLIDTILLFDEFPLSTALFLTNLYCFIEGNSESTVKTNSLELIDVCFAS
jgi:hypothetical protein